MGNGYFNNKNVSHLWEKIKDFVRDYAQVRVEPPSFVLDPETGILYMKGGANVDFIVVDGVLYYKIED